MSGIFSYKPEIERCGRCNKDIGDIVDVEQFKKHVGCGCRSTICIDCLNSAREIKIKIDDPEIMNKLRNVMEKKHS